MCNGTGGGGRGQTSILPSRRRAVCTVQQAGRQAGRQTTEKFFNLAGPDGDIVKGRKEKVPAKAMVLPRHDFRSGLAHLRWNEKKTTGAYCAHETRGGWGGQLDTFFLPRSLTQKRHRALSKSITLAVVFNLPPQQTFPPMNNFHYRTISKIARRIDLLCHIVTQPRVPCAHMV